MTAPKEKNDELRVRSLLRKIAYGWVLRFVPDALFLKCQYRCRTGKRLNLGPPKTFNEKLQWLKLHHRRPELTAMADKVQVRDIVRRTVGEEYVMPSLGVWDRLEDIDPSALPEQFVLKCTHDSGGVVVCKSRQTLSMPAARKKIRRSLATNYYWYFREWPYRDVKPRIIVEPYLVDDSGVELKDYKVWCFSGVPHLVQVDSGRFTGHRREMYDVDWNPLDVFFKFPLPDGPATPRPERLADMLDAAAKLSEGQPFLRVDFFVIGDRIYCGELTFYHGSGYSIIEPASLLTRLGDLIVLPEPTA